MKKLLGLLFALVMLFSFTTVNAAMSSSDKTLLNEVKEKAQELAGGMAVNTSISGDTVTISVPDINTTFNVTLKDNIMTYSSDGDAYETAVMQYILDAILVLRDQDSSASSVLNNISDYSFNTHGISGSMSGDNITKLKVDAKKISLAGNYKGSTSSSSTSTTTTTTTTENPKTGVFVPVIGLSVLIVASVVCLIWISKKNVFKGF